VSTTDPSRTLGVFPGEAAGRSSLRTFDRWLDGRLGSATTFVAASLPPARRHAFVRDRLTAAHEAGLVPVVTWEPVAVGDGDGDDPVATIADGEAASLLADWGSRLGDWLAAGPGRELVVRPAHEMNGSWYPWSAGAGVDPSDYRRMWRRLHTAFADAGVTGDGVRWLWSVNADPVENLSAWYPGDAYVDRVGVDGYNFGDSQPWSEWRDPAAVFEPAFERLARLDPPLTVPEFGCSAVYGDDNRPDLKADWIAAAFDRFDAWDVRLAGWFNADKETDWRVLAGPADADDYPDTVTVDGRPRVAFSSFRRAALRYLDG
jgi:hypothetical protein